MATVKRKSGQFVFDRILRNAAAKGITPKEQKKSLAWFREKASKVSDTRKRFQRDIKDKGRSRAKIELGKMYFFSYQNPKHKDTLPYWDAFPLVIPFSQHKGLIYSISLHHSPPMIRAKVMDALYDLATDERLGKNTRLALTYDVLRSMSVDKYVKPLIRSHIISRVDTPFFEVYAAEWATAIFLPYASFRKMSAQKVYAEYRKKVAKSK